MVVIMFVLVCAVGVMLMLTLCDEFEADKFATTHGHGTDLKSALITLYKMNKLPLHSDKMYFLFLFLNRL